MILLPENKHYSTKPFLENVGCDTVVAHSIIEKKQKGRIFVNDENKPTVVLFWHYCGTALLTGNSKNNIFNEAVKNILLSKFEPNQKPIKINLNSQEWVDKLNSLLGDKIMKYEASENNVIAWERQRFHFNKDKFHETFASISIPDGFEMKRIDGKMFNSIKGTVIPSVLWNNPQAFIKNGFGYCLVENTQIASTAFTAFIGNGQIDIGIETSPNYRQRGLGVIGAAHMVKFCLDNGYEPVWGCRKDNVGSTLIAKKIGFELADYHPVYFSMRQETR